MKKARKMLQTAIQILEKLGVAEVVRLKAAIITFCGLL